MSYEWPALFLDTVEWIQHRNKTGVFFHEENIFSLWTMKVTVSPCAALIKKIRKFSSYI
jgi:hypothetical protein